jgi:CDP-paratose 2-epimerase
MRSITPGRPALVVGGAGFIGSNLADSLAGAGHPVRILDNLSRPGVAENLAWLQRRHGERLEVRVADVRDTAAVAESVTGVSVVFHLAAQVAVTASLEDPLHDFAVNLGGTLTLLEALRRLRRPPPLVFTSSNKVYGCLPDVELINDGRRWRPRDPALEASGIGEDRALEFRSPYGCSKGGADQYVLDYASTFGLPATVLRMSCIYGPRQFGTEDQGWVAHFLVRALAGQELTIYGDGKQVRDLLFVDDLVDAFLRCWSRIDQLSGRAFNIGGGPRRAISLLELLELIEHIEDRAPRIRFAAWRPGDQRYYVTDTRSFASATGWQPRTSLERGIEALRAWLLERLARGRELGETTDPNLETERPLHV